MIEDYVLKAIVDPTAKLRMNYFISAGIIFVINAAAAIYSSYALFQSILDKESLQFGFMLPLTAWLVFSFVKVASGMEDFQLKFKQDIKKIETLQKEIIEAELEKVEEKKDEG